MLAQGGESEKLEEQQKARNDALLAYRKILMRLNINESLHQRLENSLESLLRIEQKSADPDALRAAVTLARTILKQEWEVTKYGPFTKPVGKIKTWWRRRKPLTS